MTTALASSGLGETNSRCRSIGGSDAQRVIVDAMRASSEVVSRAPRNLSAGHEAAWREPSSRRQAGFDAIHPNSTEQPTGALQSTESSTRYRFIYVFVGLLSMLYVTTCVAFASVYEPNLQFFSYYAVDYSQGFVRRGLAGEILGLFPSDLYFTGLVTLRWLVPAIFAIGVAAVAWTVAVRFGRSERRLMLALLIPMLPLGLVHAVVLPTPDLVGEAVLAVFAVVLVSVQRERSAPVVSGGYGLTTAVLTLIHEAIPLLQALGAVLAIVVLTNSSVKIQRLSALLAVVPGVVVAVAVAVLRRRDVSPHCARLPHKTVEWAPGQTLGGEQAYTDYHDWTCRFITVTTRQTPIIGGNPIGWAPLVMSAIAGVIIFTLTVFVIRVISSVPLRVFLQAARERLLWVTIAALLLLPVFATSADWARWWVAISFDVCVVYLLYVSQRPESTQSATRSTRVFFAGAIIFFALLPILVGVNAEQSVQHLVTRCSELAADPMWVGICP